jgi:soluble lytic murein transglycosylase
VLICLLLGSCGGSVRNSEAQSRDREAFGAYYQGLEALVDTPDAPSGLIDAYRLFETALESSNPYISAGAAEQLILPLLQGDLDAPAFYERHRKPGPGVAASGTLRPLLAAALYRLGRYREIAGFYGEDAPPPGQATGDLALWDRIIPLTARVTAQAADALREDIQGFLFDAAPGEPLRWAVGELRRVDFLTAVETALLEGRFATARSSFGGGLTLFSLGLKEEPALFLHYPALITDLGRCFQFTSSGDEGIELFLEWEQQAAAAAQTRYRLLYFAGRIARARGAFSRSQELFTQALAFAPDNAQEDACIWYVLDCALLENAPTAIDLLKTWMPRWHDPAYFSDILDRIARNVASSGQWRRFPELLELLEGRGDQVSIAKYAYISARGLAQGLIPLESGQREASNRYFRIAYDAGGWPAALYYRAMSANFLKEPFLSLEKPAEDAAQTVSGTTSVPFPHPREMEFLLGFFEDHNGLIDRAYSRIEAMGPGLDIGELRTLAEALAKAEAYPEQIRLVSAYMVRADYVPVHRDLELLSPRPFRETVEEQARAASIFPETLYGLIRTESAFQAEIVSRSGAVGLTQLMPGTAVDMAGRIRRQGGPDYTGDMTANLRKADAYIHIGAYYLAYLQNLLDHPLLSILAYNGGMNRVRRWRAAAASLPGDLFLETIEYPETREYGRRVFSAAVVYGYLYYDMNLDTLLADICR